MAVLDRMGDRELLRENIRAFFGGMAEKTGTLWEYREAHKSMDHGFASFVATLM
jgi:alpha-L-rhamnosidase